MNELHRLDIAHLHDAYAAGETSPSAVAEHYLARIDWFDGKLKAFIEVDAEGALTVANECDARVDSGAMRPLEGVPVAVKANIAVADLEWNAGMEARRGLIAGRDADAVARLRDAGAIVLGTLNMEEAALGAATDNVWFGRAFNPHGEGLTPGGSSGGSGSAVAAGLCVASLGTDTLGSVRIPATYNGVYGLKPTNGTISSDGLAPVSEWLDTIGPLARSLDDLEVLWWILSNSDDGRAPGIDRLLLLDDLAGVECEPAVQAAYRRAVDVLSDLERDTISFEDSLKGIRTAAFVDATRELRGHLRDATRETLSGNLNQLLDYGDARSPEKLARDKATIDRSRSVLLAALKPSTVLLTPTVPQSAFKQGTEAPLNQADFSALANIGGLPALSLPAGRDERGLPVGVQLVGWPGSEDALFALGRRLDAALNGYFWPEGY